MDTQQDNLEYLSEDVQEILSNPPSWVMLWGTATIVLVLTLITLVGWFFRYPEKVKGEVELTTPLPPVPIIAPKMLTIAKFEVNEGSVVQKNDLIAMLESSANLEDVNLLEDDVNKLLLQPGALAVYEPKESLVLGEIGREYVDSITLFKSF